MSSTPRPSGVPRKIPAWAWKWLKWRTGPKKPKPAPTPTPSPKPAPKPTQMFMYDDVNLSLIPATAQAVAGYVGGHYPTYVPMVAKFPHAKHLSIAVTASENARCLDVEPGDATIAQAPAWVKKQKEHGEKLPVLYTSAAQGQKLVDACTKAGLVYGKDYLWWSAHYSTDLGKHLCGPGCGFGLRVHAHATQFTDKALGRSLDESVLTPGFFP